MFCCGLFSLLQTIFITPTDTNKTTFFPQVILDSAIKLINTGHHCAKMHAIMCVLVFLSLCGQDLICLRLCGCDVGIFDFWPVHLSLKFFLRVYTQSGLPLSFG